MVDLILLPLSTTSSLNVNNNNSKLCIRCDSICGSRFYECPDDDCGFVLDLTCALNIKILHRSHEHRLTTIKGKSLSSLFCGACGTQHQPLAPGDTWQVTYMCICCDFWIHPDCALLPNAILLEHHHPHPLLLSYLSTYCNDRVLLCCAFCDQWFHDYLGFEFYTCFHCGYSAHIKCAGYSDPDRISFKPVLLEDANIPNLVRLPMPNEHANVMKAVLTNYVDGASSSSFSSSGGDHQSEGIKLFENDKIHEHPLILHDHYPAIAGVARVCNACVQLISPSDPFYNCANNNNNNNNEVAMLCCRDFFLHWCCAHLPTTLHTKHPSHFNNGHPLTLRSNKQANYSVVNNMFECVGCRRICNGFAYTCEKCNYNLDVVCAFMHTSIMHDGHAKSHILRPCRVKDCICICCDNSIDHLFGEMGYECNSCRKFSIHAKCALLPDTCTHKFDRHALKLITTERITVVDDYHQPVVARDVCNQEEEETMFCEIFEEDMDNRSWYYGCKDCDQYFHIDCIPALDKLSKIKFGFTTTVLFCGHDCPLECVRALSVDGYRCGHCQESIRESDNRIEDRIAFECSNCYYRIHGHCVVIYFR